MPSLGILGFVRLGHGFAIPTPHYTTFFCAVKRFAFSLSGTKKRQLPRTLNDMPIIWYGIFSWKNKGGLFCFRIFVFPRCFRL